MKTWLKSIYCGYSNIGVLGDVLSKWNAADLLPQMDTDNTIRLDQADDHDSGIAGFNQVDLIIIDLDTFGSDKAKFLIFLANCLTPKTPLVLVTEKNLEEPTRRCLLTGRVHSIIEKKSSIGSSAVTAV